MTPQGWIFLAYVVVLAAMLFIPVSRLIWVLSVRRLERRLDRPLDDGEREGQRRRARVLTAFVVLLFSLLFNISTVGLPQ